MGLKVGILGGGQLGRMLALAGHPLGMSFRFLDPGPDSPAAGVGELVVGGFDDEGAIDRFARGLDVCTFEFENVPAELVERLEKRLPVFPGSKALRVAQDRVSEKTFFSHAQLDVHPWAPVDDLAGLGRAVGKIGVPGVLKTRRGGYDGKGQAVVRERDALGAAWERIGARPAIYEAMVPFTRELSIVAVRGQDGSFAAYPLAENRHEGGILRHSRAPALGVAPAIERAADEHCRTLLEELGYVGVLAVEFFEHEGRLLANEMAPRVHNSGHWTIEGAATSQFENHLRAVAGLPLGSCAARAASQMFNLIGGVPGLGELAGVPGAHVHLYGKEPRPGRKVGHVTLVEAECADPAGSARRIEALVRAAGAG